MVPPIAIDAGLGQHVRHSALVTPELGGNFRPAIITTNIPIDPDLLDLNRAGIAGDSIV